MTSFNIDFAIPADYTYDTNKIEVSGGKAKLKLIPDDPHICSETFDSDVGFIYDNTRAEFVGGQVQEKNLQPANSVVWATYTSSFNLNYAPSGSLTATLIGSPQILGSRLACLGGINIGLYYENSNIADVATQGTIKFKFTPNYSGTPTANTNLTEISEGAVAKNKIVLFHGTVTGAIRISTWNSINGSVLSAYSIASWNPSAGVTYEFELDFNTVTGVFQLFLGGVQQGSIPTTIYTRTNTANRIYVGAGTTYPVANGYYEDVILFNTVQHTSNYTPGYALPEAKYEGSLVQLPPTENTGPGVFISVQSISSIQAGTPRYIAQPGATGSYYYWNGSIWAVSDQSYSQANDITTFSNNISTLDVYGQTKCRVAIVFQNENTLSSVSQLDATVIQQVYPTDSPTIYKTAGDQKDVLVWLSFVETLGSGNQGSITHQLSLDGSTWKYWNGSSFVDVVNPTDYNTASVLNTIIKNFTDNQLLTIYVRSFLISNGQQQVELENIQLIYVHKFDCPLVAEVQDEYFQAKKENSCAINLLMKDISGNIITDLVLADSVKLMLKHKAFDSDTDAVITKDLTNGIFIDNPSAGYIRVVLESSELSIDIGDYYIGIEIRWDDNVREACFRYKEQITNIYSVTQDVIRG